MYIGTFRKSYIRSIEQENIASSLRSVANFNFVRQQKESYEVLDEAEHNRAFL